MKKSYVGITGFTSPDQVSHVLGNANFSPKGRLLMVGVLVNHKTLRGLPPKRPSRYPGVASIASIFPNDSRCLNLVHYNTKEPWELSKQLTEVMEVGGTHCHGVQINMPWPDPDELERFKERYPNKAIVLQIGPKALERTGHNLDLTTQSIGDYTDRRLIDYALFDPSGGRGTAFDPLTAVKYLRAFHKRTRDSIGLCVAGGLSAITLRLLEPILDKLPQVSVDAEGRLRTPEPEDKLDLDCALDYARNTLDLFLTYAA